MVSAEGGEDAASCSAEVLTSNHTNDCKSMKPSFNLVFALVLGFMLAPTAIAETTNVSVTIDAVNSKRPVISVTYGNTSRQLTLADDAAIEIDGNKSDYRSLLPGDQAVVTYDKVKSAVTKIVVQRDAIAPAEALAEGWQEIDQRLIFLMIRLANVEASLEAVERAIDADSRKRGAKSSSARKADRDNEAMDRKGGGPVKWSQFYGLTAEKFFYHPTDRNTTYHTETVLSQQGSPADNKVGGGVPAGQGLPVHQRPPQFDYIYRANDSAKARAELEASELLGKIDALNERRQRLEAEQAGLWVEIAFRAIAHYDLDQKPVYRFEPLLVDLDTNYIQRTDAMKSAASFMALALSIMGEAEKNQQGTFLKLKPAVAKGRQTLNDNFLRLAVDNTDSQSSVGRFTALAKRLDDVSANLTDSYLVATEGDLAGDQQRKDTFRALLQSSLINYAQIILAMDEMAELMKEECNFEPNVDKSIQFVGLSKTEAVPTPLLPKSDGPTSSSRSSKKESSRGFQQQFRFAVEKEIKADWNLRAEDRLWSIENKSLKFSVPGGFPGASIDLRYVLNGEIFIELTGTRRGGSRVWVHMFGVDKEIEVGDGPFRVHILRKENNIQFNVNGNQSSITIKDAVSDSPTRFAISWGLRHNSGGSTWISGVSIKASEAKKDGE
jgi:hypothetical protein